MRKFFISRLRSLSLLSVLAVMVAFGSGKSFAALTTCDLGELEIGKSYSHPSFATVTGYFTAPATGTMTAINFGDLDLYLDEAHTQMLDKVYKGYQDKGQAYAFELTEGTKYYVYTYMSMNAATFTMYMDGVAAQPLQIQYINVDPNTVFNFANYKNLEIQFNQDFTMDEKVQLMFSDMKTGGDVYLDLKVTKYPQNVTISVYNEVKPYIESGNLLPGSQIAIVLKNVKTKSGALIEGADEEGNFWMPFACGYIPTVRTGDYVPAKFLSYWAPGDPEGMLTMSFDKPVSESEHTCVEFGYGNLEGEDGEYYGERIPVSVSEDGLTLVADFTGKLRTPLTMTPQYASTVYSEVSLKLVGVVDAYGNPVQSEGQGTIGSYSWSVPYEVIEKTIISAEFTPANGESLAGAEEISVFLSPVNTFSFTGFNIAYTDGAETKNTVVDKNNCSSIKLSTDGTEATYTFAIPAEVKGKKNVVVTLAGLTSNDGYDHSNDVRATYDAFVITFADPANGAELAGLNRNDVISIETNYSAQYPEMYIVYEIEDLNPVDPDQAVVKTQAWLTKEADSDVYTATIYGSVKFLLGHEYKVTFTAWENEMAKNYRMDPIGEAYLIWKGTTPAYVYSDIQLVSITPAPSDDLMLTADDNVFTVEFDGLVMLNSETTFINVGQGMTQAFESIVPEDPQDGYSNKWVLTVPMSFMNSLTASLDISIKATDMNGRAVKGNLGTDENTYFYFVYDYAGRYASYDVKAAGEEPYATVKEFIASSERGINFAYAVAVDQAYVMNQSREIVANVAEVIAGEASLGQKCTSQTLVLDKEITTAGHYILIIPRDYFFIDEEFSSQNSEQVMYDFNVVGNGSDECTVELDPAEGEVASLPASIQMFFPGYSSIAIGAGAPTLTIDGGAPIKLDDVQLDWDIWNMATIVLPQEYTDPGTYVISFPAGYFLLGDAGIDSPALTFTYVVLAEAPRLNITCDPAEGVVSELPANIQLTFNDYDEISLGAGHGTLTIDGGEPVNLDDAQLDWDIWNKAIIVLPQAYTENGTYVISFPAGYFLLGSAGENSPVVTLTYTISTATGISNVIVAVDGMYHVYTVAGVKVLETADYNDVKALNPGLYIVNGVKLLVK